ncbi:MAG: DUF3108 domain-containing protein [Marinilabiliales bacterium]
MKTTGIAILFLLLSHFAMTQCDVVNNAFSRGEYFDLDIMYNWGPIWVNAGTVYFKVDSTYDNKSVFHFKSYGRTLDSWDWFMKVRDLYESYALEKQLKSIYYFRKIIEGNKVIFNRYRFDYNSMKIYSSLYYSDEGEKQDTLDIKQCTFDPLTAIYYARTIDYNNAAINQKFPIRILIDNEIHDLYIRYLGKEDIEDRKGNSYHCIKFTIKMVEGTIFSGGEDITVWVSDDKNKIPILVKAEIIVGSIKAYLNHYQGLKNPFDAKIN